MDARVKRLDTIRKCDSFARNAEERGAADLAAQARVRSLELQAGTHAVQSDVERECLQAVYAYEQAQAKLTGRKRFRATRTWQMIDRHGILKAAERAVDRDTTTMGYEALRDLGLTDYAFEQVILRHPEFFSESAVRRARERVEGVFRG